MHCLGIDLGTTRTAAAFLTESGHTEMLRNSDGEILTPSVVLFNDRSTIVGSEALMAQPSAPERVADYVKRDMGLPYYSRPIRGCLIPPEVIQATILRRVCSDAVRQLGEDIKSVITVPAYFDEPRRQATADAGSMSGLDVIDIVNEPTAAALAYGEQLGYLNATGEPRGRMNLLVYDLGGGTFDVTVIRLEPGKITTLATDGDARLGGLDWDMTLLEHAKAAFELRYPDSPPINESGLIAMRMMAEKAKQTLSLQNSVVLRLSYAEKNLDVRLSRAEFEQWSASLVDRTELTTRQVVREAGLLWDDIDRILLTGGSTRMPIIPKMLYKLTGIVPDSSVNPDEAVARGAAIFAAYRLSTTSQLAIIPPLAVTDVNAHSLGIEGINVDALRREHVKLIPHNTPLPCEVRRQFVTKSDNQSTVVIKVLEGESSLPGHCSTIGKAVIRDLPPGLPRGTPVDVCYAYNADSRLSVSASIPGTEREVNMELQRSRGLPCARASQWKEIICCDGGLDSMKSLLEEPPCVPENSSSRSTADDGRQDQESYGLFSKEAAVPFGAPQAAADRLEESATTFVRKPGRPTSFPYRRSKLSPLIMLTGNIVASLIGLAVGYYIACLIRPELNVLRLDIPGLHAP